MKACTYAITGCFSQAINTLQTLPSHVQFTRETGIFDLLNVRLVHGWLVDPQVCVFGGETLSMRI